MPKSKTDFTNFVDARPNYFPGQFLLEDDFEVEQKYLIDRQKYHRQSLHVSGIVEGLEVEVINDRQEVQIKSGSGINSNGDLIVLKKDTSFSQFASLTNGELYISYREEKQVKQQEDFTRWQEVPTIGFAATTPNHGVKLAKISIVNNVLTLDLTVRDYSGIFLPNATGNDLTLRSGGNANPNLAILNGSLTVTGTITGKIDATSINSGVLAVDRIPSLPANKITTGVISGDLTVTGTITGNIDAISIKSGVLAVDRIPSLPASKISSGELDVARIPSLPASKISSGELEVARIPNLSASKITAGTTQGDFTIGRNLKVTGTSSFGGNLDVTGNVGIGIANPTKGKLHIEGNAIHNLGDIFVYLAKPQGTDLMTNRAAPGNNPYSVYASDRIAAKEFNAFSDLRIKEIKGNSDSQADLQTLLQIQVTDYYYKDKIANDNKPQKKVIGQQIAAVYPQAVSTHADIVPDILQFTVIDENWVTLNNHNFKIGDKVKILWDDNKTQLFPVEAIEADKFKISLNYNGDVFAYGREVDDFHVVDYDALSMLHISATQEIYRMIKKMQSEMSELKKQNHLINNV